MIVLRKLFSGYQLTNGVSYIKEPGVGIANSVIDDTDAVLNWTEKTPVLKELPNKKKRLIRSYMKSLKKLINNKKE